MRIVTYAVMGLLAVSIVGCLKQPQASSQAHEPPALNLGIEDGHPEPVKIALDRDGIYTQGPWRYVFKITHPGTRSQGSLGKLTYADEPIPIPEDAGGYYDTPLGRFVYVGMPSGSEIQPIMPWRDKGWMPASSQAPGPPN